MSAPRAGWIGALATGASLLCAEPVLSAERCQPAQEAEGLPVPLDRIDDGIRCTVALTVTRPTTVGAVGPVHAPVTREIYEYLLDHPWLIAAFARPLGLGNYEAVSMGRDQFWANDGGGAEGLVRLAYHGETARLYYINGHHHGRIFPLVRAKAVVVMRLAQVGSESKTPMVEATLQAYTRLDDPVLDRLARLLRPLVAGAITRKLTRSFEVLNQLCVRLAQAPDQVLELATPASAHDPKEIELLKSLLHGLPRQATTVPSAASGP